MNVTITKNIKRSSKQMVGEIKPFTQSEVSKMVSSIPCHQLNGFNKKVDDNFVSLLML